MSKFKIGDKVKYIGKDYREMPEYYPEIGTIGTLVKEGGDTDWYIQWPKGSTSRKDCWYCNKNDIELVKDTDMTNEEIWKMLESKMRKNWLIPHWGEKELVYYQSDVINAIAIAYRSGYERAMKGRPFKFDEKKEKKKGGHWEPVDPENLPKEGTRVRYGRKNIDWNNSTYVEIGDTGTIQFWEGFFGFNLDVSKGLDWICILTQADCLDMWVEDDE